MDDAVAVPAEGSAERIIGLRDTPSTGAIAALGIWRQIGVLARLNVLAADDHGLQSNPLRRTRHPDSTVARYLVSRRNTQPSIRVAGRATCAQFAVRSNTCRLVRCRTTANW